MITYVYFLTFTPVLSPWLSVVLSHIHTPVVLGVFLYLLGVHFSTRDPSDTSTQAVGPALDLQKPHLIHQGSSEVESPPLHCDPVGTGCGAMGHQTHPCGYVLPTPGGANHPSAQIPHKVHLYRKGDSHCE